MNQEVEIHKTYQKNYGILTRKQIFFRKVFENFQKYPKDFERFERI